MVSENSTAYPLPAQSDKHLHSTLILKFKLCLAKDLRTLFKRPGGRKTPLSGVEAVVLLVASVTVLTPALFAFASSPRGVIREDDDEAAGGGGFWPCIPPLPLALPNDDDAILTALVCCRRIEPLLAEVQRQAEKMMKVRKSPKKCDDSGLMLRKCRDDNTRTSRRAFPPKVIRENWRGKKLK